MPENFFTVTSLALAPISVYWIRVQSRMMLQRFEVDTRICDSTFARKAPLVHAAWPWIRGLYYSSLLMGVWLQPPSRIASGRYSLEPEFATKSDFLKHFSKRDIAHSAAFYTFVYLFCAVIALAYFIEVP